MTKKSKQIPEEFKTYEEAAGFWDTHESTDFLDELEDVKMKVDIKILQK
ncbi:CopG antitoxin of type II toxin-antitoxin system [uncultured archaeon]|nr:CopG antitoxin of type II toxin-antitoxin system [uncultured archaeon]